MRAGAMDPPALSPAQLGESTATAVVYEIMGVS